MQGVEYIYLQIYQRIRAPQKPSCLPPKPRGALFSREYTFTI